MPISNHLFQLFVVLGIDVGQIGRRFVNGTPKILSRLMKVTSKDMNQKMALKLSESIVITMNGFGTYLINLAN
ncbi:MAG: hypothetical protein ACI8XX_001387 [Polaribacter sp.]|jgi:hypothetical protein